jgi:putative CRISPR-associated protein (TIGR02619 family)
MTQASMLICTVGTSLFRPNLESLERDFATGAISDSSKKLAQAYARRDWRAVASELANMPPTERLCGAEINSIDSMVERGYVAHDCGLFFLHSDTDDGRSIATILKAYFEKRGHVPVETVEVPDLQDKDPRRFRTKGLRNLARNICHVIRERSTSACAINATGGYKAQIAIGVLLGQAIGVPVYYKHELFSEIIAFPPMPVALDFEVWMRASGMLYGLEGASDPVPVSHYAEEWNEKYESLVERVEIDGQDYLELSATGQIFHETFRERFRCVRDEILPPPVPASQKTAPRLEQAGWPGKHPDVERFMTNVTNQVPQVVCCATSYYNPDLPERTRFRESRGGIEGIYSDGSFTVKFDVQTSAKTPGQRAAVVAALNELLIKRN